MNRLQTNWKRWFGFPLLLCILYAMAVSSAVFSQHDDRSGSNHPVEDIDFYDLIGLQRSDITGLSVQMLGTHVKLEMGFTEEILDSFELAACVEVLEEEPFTESECILSIESESRIESYAICWFNGLAFDENGKQNGYADRRFDVLIDGTWYVFRQDEETYWNEDKMVLAYKKSARLADIDIPVRYQRDGYDQELLHYGYGSLVYPDNGRWACRYDISRETAEEIIRRSKQVVLAECVGEVYVLWKNTESVKAYQKAFKMRTQETVKGNEFETLFYVETNSDTGKDHIWNGRREIWYPCWETPDFKRGETYLLCLYQDNDALDSYELYGFSNEITDCAVVYDDVTYPRYNTEYHPFYKIKLDEIRHYAAD